MKRPMYISMSLESEAVDELQTTELEDDSQKFAFKILDRLGNPLTPQQVQVFNIQEGHDLYLTPHFFESVMQQKECIQFNPYKGDTFALGIMVLKCGLMVDVGDLYNVDNGTFSHDLLREMKTEFVNIFNDAILTELLDLLLEVDDSKRLSPKGIQRKMEVILSRLSEKPVEFQTQEEVPKKEQGLYSESESEETDKETETETEEESVSREDQRKNKEVSEDESMKIQVQEEFEQSVQEEFEQSVQEEFEQSVQEKSEQSVQEQSTHEQSTHEEPIQDDEENKNDDLEEYQEFIEVDENLDHKEESQEENIDDVSEEQEDSVPEPEKMEEAEVDNQEPEEAVPVYQEASEKEELSEDEQIITNEFDNEEREAEDMAVVVSDKELDLEDKDDQSQEIVNDVSPNQDQEKPEKDDEFLSQEFQEVEQEIVDDSQAIINPDEENDMIEDEQMKLQFNRKMKRNFDQDPEQEVSQDNGQEDEDFEAFNFDNNSQTEEVKRSMPEQGEEEGEVVQQTLVIMSNKPESDLEEPSEDDFGMEEPNVEMRQAGNHFRGEGEDSEEKVFQEVIQIQDSKPESELEEPSEDEFELQEHNVENREIPSRFKEDSEEEVFEDQIIIQDSKPESQLEEPSEGEFDEENEYTKAVNMPRRDLREEMEGDEAEQKVTIAGSQPESDLEEPQDEVENRKMAGLPPTHFKSKTEAEEPKQDSEDETEEFSLKAPEVEIEVNVKEEDAPEQDEVDDEFTEKVFEEVEQPEQVDPKDREEEQGWIFQEEDMSDFVTGYDPRVEVEDVKNVEEPNVEEVELEQKEDSVEEVELEQKEDSVEEIEIEQKEDSVEEVELEQKEDSVEEVELEKKDDSVEEVELEQKEDSVEEIEINSSDSVIAKENNESEGVIELEIENNMSTEARDNEDEEQMGSPEEEIEVELNKDEEVVEQSIHEDDGEVKEESVHESNISEDSVQEEEVIEQSIPEEEMKSESEQGPQESPESEAKNSQEEVQEVQLEHSEKRDDSREQNLFEVEMKDEFEIADQDDFGVGNKEGLGSEENLEVEEMPLDYQDEDSCRDEGEIANPEEQAQETLHKEENPHAKSLKQMILNESHPDLQSKTFQPEGDHENIEELVIEEEPYAEQQAIELKNPNEPDIRYQAVEQEFDVELKMPSQPELLKSLTQSPLVLIRQEISKPIDKVFNQNSAMPTNIKEYLNNVENYNQNKYTENLPENVQPAIQVERAQPVQYNQQPQYQPQQQTTIPVMTSHRMAKAPVVMTSYVPSQHSTETPAPFSKSNEIQRIKNRYFPKPLASKVVQSIPQTRGAVTTQPLVTQGSPSNLQARQVTKILQSHVIEPVALPPVYTKSPQAIRTRTQYPQKDTAKFKSFAHDSVPQVAVKANQTHMAFNKKVEPVSTIIAKERAYNTNSMPAEYKPEVTFQTPKRVNFPEQANTLTPIINNDSSVLGEELPLSSIFKNLDRLKQSVQVFRNPESNNKRIILNNSSKFKRTSQIGTNEKITSSMWKTQDNRSVPSKKKQMYSQTRTPLNKQDAIARQHSVSANTHYPKIGRAKRISVQYDTSEGNRRTFQDPYQQSSFKNATSTPNNQVRYSSNKPVHQEIISANYVNHNNETNWTQNLPTKNVNAPIRKSLTPVSPLGLNVARYSSNRGNGLVESKILVARKTSQNEPALQVNSNRVVTYTNKTPTVLSVTKQNSIPWTDIKTEQTNSYQPNTMQPLKNSFYPSSNMNVRVSNGPLTSEYQYKTNDEYNFSSYQNTRSANTGVSKESIVLSRQRNPQEFSRLSEIKSGSFESSSGMRKQTRKRRIKLDTYTSVGVSEKSIEVGPKMSLIKRVSTNIQSKPYRESELHIRYATAIPRGQAEIRNSVPKVIKLKNNFHHNGGYSERKY